MKRRAQQVPAIVIKINDETEEYPEGHLVLTQIQFLPDPSGNCNEFSYLCAVHCV